MDMGADFLATGHYCRVGKNNDLLKGRDSNKDQSYFLYTLKEKILSKVMFPIGDLEKLEVRAIAKKYNLVNSEKKDSTGICFIGERNFKNFLSNYIKSHQGDFKTLNGTVVGSHSGTPFYTLGQRKGLGLGGAGDPWFVVGKDVDKNIIYVERGDDHPALYCDKAIANELSFVKSDFKLQEDKTYLCKVRYRQVDQECKIHWINSDSIEVSFLYPQRAVTEGQSIVFYDGEICLGGVVVGQTADSYYLQNKKLP